MTLTLRQLEVFLATAEDCNFRRAAERLGISQPSVSGRIRSLEGYLGYELFDRATGSTPRLTPAGREFLGRARQLVSGASDLAGRRRPAPARSPLRLTVVIGPLLLKHRVMPELPSFCYEHPEVAADFISLGGTTDGKDLIRRGKADVLLYTGDPPQEADLDAEIIGSTRCSIFGAKHLLACVGPSAQEMETAPFILPPEHHTWASWVRGRLASIGVDPRNIIARPQFPDLIVQMMAEGRGFSVFFDEFISDERLRRTALALPAASRVMIIGPRARQSAAAPILSFLRRVSAVCEPRTCQ